MFWPYWAMQVQTLHSSRDNKRQSLSEDYVSLCSPQILITEYLFGNDEDLQQRVNDITASNKISKTTARKDLKFSKSFQGKTYLKQSANKALSGQGYPQQNHNPRKTRPWKKPGSLGRGGRMIHSNSPQLPWKQTTQF